MNAHDRIAAVRSHLLADPGLWCQNTTAIRDCHRRLKSGCLGYLLEWVSPKVDSKGAAVEARTRLAIVAGMPRAMALAAPYMTLGEWNDEYGRTVADVIALCEKALAAWDGTP